MIFLAVKETLNLYRIIFNQIFVADGIFKKKSLFTENELNKVYDINGWDLKKFFKQLYKSNPVIFEWADSPIVYRTSEEWEKVKTVMKDYVKLKAMIYHLDWLKA